MIVIFNNNFLDKIRRVDNTITISSYTLDTVAPGGYSAEDLLGYTGGRSEVINNLRGIWESDAKKFKVCLETPDSILVNPDQVSDMSVKEVNLIRFYSEGETAFVVVDEDPNFSSEIHPLDIPLSQNKTLITLQFPDSTLATIKSEVENADDTFLEGYAADLGENLFSVGSDGQVMITNDSFFKYFGIKIAEIKKEAVPYIINDIPSLNEFGEKINNNYTYKVYKSIEFTCAGLETDCWVPTKFGLMKNYDILKGRIKLLGKADFEEYLDINGEVSLVGSGSEVISKIPGLEVVEVGHSGLNYHIDYNTQELVYTVPTSEEDYNPNHCVYLLLRIRKPDGTILESNTIRFLMGTRDDEWQIISSTTSYSEPVNKTDVPVFLFPYDQIGSSSSPYIHKLVIRTSFMINEPRDLTVTTGNPLLDNYFNIEVSTEKEFDIEDIFKDTLITLKLTTKVENDDAWKWNPLNASGDSELMVATISYNDYSTDFFMVQSPKVKGLALYEFNPIGANFSRINSITLESIETSHIYWMFTEEKTIPKEDERPWWATRNPNTEEDKEVTVTGLRYLKKDSFLLPSEEGDPVITEECGNFTGVFSLAFRPDVEVTDGASGFITISEDTERLGTKKYLAIFDSFSIDQEGYITLEHSKVTEINDNNGGGQDKTQYDSDGGKNTEVGDANATPIGRSFYESIVRNNTTYVTKSKSSESDYSNTELVTLTTTDGQYYGINENKPSAVYNSNDTIRSFIEQSDNPKSPEAKAVEDAIVDTNIVEDPVKNVNEEDSVIAFVNEDGTIGYTSKKENRAVKIATDTGKIIMDPRRIWDNRKLRPVVVNISARPTDHNDLIFEPITFFRVSQYELGHDYNADTWRNVVRRAQVTYPVIKKGQDPFIQIIGNTREEDVEVLQYVGGRFVTKIIPGNSSLINTTMIDRGNFLVRSNCPFKLSFKYASGFGNTLAFDDIPEEMLEYNIAASYQTLYSERYDSTYGKTIYFDVNEADDTGKICKIEASYGDLVVSSDVYSNVFTGENSAITVDSDGNLDPNLLSKLIIVSQGVPKNVYVKGRRTLSSAFTSFRDIVDDEPVVKRTADNRRESLKYGKLRIGPINPKYDTTGYVNHTATLDIEKVGNGTTYYPINPLGLFSVLPYKYGGKYSPTSKNGSQFYVYEGGINPEVRVKTFPNVLGGVVPDGSDTDKHYYESIDVGGKVYTLSKWVNRGEVDARKGRDGDVIRVPVCWINSSNGEELYSLPGALDKEIETSGGDYIRKILYDTEVVTGDPDHTLGLDDELYSCVKYPCYWSRLDEDNVRIGQGPAAQDNTVYVTSKINDVVPLLNDKSCISNEDVVANGDDLNRVNITDYIYYPKIWHDNPVKVSNSIKTQARISIPHTSGPNTIEVRPCFVGTDGKYYIRHAKLDTTYPYLYTLKGEYGDVSYKADPNADIQLSTITTFSILSKYRLQYVKISRALKDMTNIDTDPVTSEIKVNDTPTKRWLTYFEDSEYISEEQALGAINVLDRDTQSATETIGEFNTDKYDIDIHVIPEYDAETGVPLFSITNIVELDSSFEDYRYEYRITVAPRVGIGSGPEETTLRRFCGKIKITSRVRSILENNGNVPSEIINSFAKVLPLTSNGQIIYGKTRPRNGVVWSGNSNIDYVYEKSVLGVSQDSINSFVPESEIVLDIYQQKDPYMQIYGDRTEKVLNNESRVYSITYVAGTNYHYYDEEQHLHIVELNKDNLYIDAKVVGDTPEYNYDTTGITITTANGSNAAPIKIPTGNVNSGTGLETYEAPYSLVNFNSIFSNYYPKDLVYTKGESGTPGLCSDYKDGNLRKKAIDFKANLMDNIRISTDYFTQRIEGGNIVTTNIGGTDYQIWDKYEKSEDDTYKKYEGYSILIKANQLLQLIDEDHPLRPDYTMMVDADSNGPATYTQYFNTRGDYLIRLTEEDGVKKLWKNGNEIVPTLIGTALEERVEYTPAGVNSGIVCKLPNKDPKLYLGDSPRNVIDLRAGGTDTYVDFFAGLFNLVKPSNEYYYFKKTNTSSGFDTWTAYKLVNGTESVVSPNVQADIVQGVDYSTVNLSNPVIPAYVRVNGTSKDITFEFIGNGENINHEQVLYSGSFDQYSITGTTDFGIVRADTISKEWSPSIIPENTKLSKNSDWVYSNNIRINFPENISDTDLIRVFKIMSNPDVNGVVHEVTVNIHQDGYLGTIYCDDSIRLNPDGTYFSGDAEDPYFYIDTDIPRGELEFEIIGEKSPILSVSNLVSEYGPEFRKYKLSIKVGNNSNNAIAVKSLRMIRHYNVYDQDEDKLVSKSAIRKTVELRQGYKSLYISNPAYLQATIIGGPTGIPEYLCSGGIVASSSYPLIIPKIATKETATSGMNYRMRLTYEEGIPDPNSNSDFIITTKEGNDLINYLVEKGVKITTSWEILNSTLPGERAFEKEPEGEIVTTDEDHGSNLPYLFVDYEFSDSTDNLRLDLYPKITVSLGEDKYRFFLYMRKQINI